MWQLLLLGAGIAAKILEEASKQSGPQTSSAAPPPTATPVRTIPQTSAITATLTDLIDCLSGPIEEVLEEAHFANVGSRELLRNELLCLTVRFQTVDNPLSDTEIPVLMDVVRLTLPGQADGLNGPAVRKIVLDLKEKDREFFEGPSQKPAMLRLAEAYDAKHGTKLGPKTRNVLFSLANHVMKADGRITEKEQAALRAFAAALRESDGPTLVPEMALVPQGLVDSIASFPSPGATPVPYDARALEEALAKLRGLTGLERVKEEVGQLTAYIKVQQLRKSHGLKTPPPVATHGLLGKSRHRKDHGRPDHR